MTWAGTVASKGPAAREGGASGTSLRLHAVRGRLIRRQTSLRAHAVRAHAVRGRLIRRHRLGAVLTATVSRTAATTPSQGSGNSEPPRIPISW